MQNLALALQEMGVQQNDRVGILSENCPEWTFADLAVLSLGAVTVPIYPTLGTDDIEFIVRDAGLKVLFVSTWEQLEKMTRRQVSALVGKTVVFESSRSSQNQSVFLLASLLEQGAAIRLKKPGLFDELLSAGSPQNLATLIYTSGTTGQPKGVMLTHENFIANYLGAKEHIQIREDDIALSFLPLSHVFERLAGYYFMLLQGASIAYAESMQTVADDIQIVRPTVAAAVPRFYEKIYQKILEEVNKGRPIKKVVFDWACHIGRGFAACVSQKKTVGFLLSLQYQIASALVFRKIKAKLGGRIRFFISGGAPLSRDLAEFFFAAGILILEGYGLTETSPVIAVNSIQNLKFGTVGKILPNVEVKIAGDGEILTRGPCVMQGYYHHPEATQEVMESGWFKTGDIGEIDSEGFLKITDRKKDIIVTSGGKNIAPQKLENMILADPLFRQAVVIGDKRNYLVALLALNPEMTVSLAGEHGISGAFPEIIRKPEFYQLAEGRIQERLRGLPSFEQIKYFAFLERELSLAEGELTPTLKVKRRLIMQKHAALIDSLYRHKKGT